MNSISPEEEDNTSISRSSWQIEIIISGGAIYSLYQLSDNLYTIVENIGISLESINLSLILYELFAVCNAFYKIIIYIFCYSHNIKSLLDLLNSFKEIVSK